MDPQEEQENEMIVLESIFENDFERTDDGFSITLTPFPRGSKKKAEENHVACVLTVVHGPTYPATAPASLMISPALGLAAAHVGPLTAAAESAAASLVGAVSIFEITEALKAYLLENNVKEQASMRDTLQAQLDADAQKKRLAEAAEAERRAEEEARAKAAEEWLSDDEQEDNPTTIDIPANTYTNVEVFTAWNQMFLAEQAQRRKRLGLDEVQTKPTGRQLFLQSMAAGLKLGDDDDDDEEAAAAAAAAVAKEDADAGKEVFWFNEGIYGDGDDDEVLPEDDEDDAAAANDPDVEADAAAAAADTPAATGEEEEEQGTLPQDDPEEEDTAAVAEPGARVAVSERATHSGAAIMAMMRDLAQNGYHGPSLADLVSKQRASEVATTAAETAEKERIEAEEQKAAAKKAAKQAKKDEKTVAAFAPKATAGGFADFLGDDDPVFGGGFGGGFGAGSKDKKDKKEKKDKK